MRIYEAVMAAAGQIEREPGRFKFTTTNIPGPGDCGSPGCALGWIASFLGLHAVYEASCLLVSGAAWVPSEYRNYDGEFYARMNAIEMDWAWDAAKCARALRLYATKYLKPDTPDWEAMADRLAVEPMVEA